jgi:glucosamine-6-phosphate deaminase
MRELVRDSLRTAILPDRLAMGEAAADYAAERLRGLLAQQDRVRVMFAAAASQAEMLDALGGRPGLAWGRVEAFHLDEYIGLPPGHPQHFGEWLERHIWSRVRPGRIERLDGANPAGPDAEAARYGTLLADGGVDLALVGVGENGHVAFNDPHVAEFDDPLWVKPVVIDETSRRQQVRDGAFARVEDVPGLALTVTMSAIRACRALSIVVPGPQKAAAVAAMLDGPVATSCPASILRSHPDARMFLDEAAASGLAAAAG